MIRRATTTRPLRPTSCIRLRRSISTSKFRKRATSGRWSLWQRIGVYAAGLALSDAGIAGKPDLLDRTDMIVAAGGGERDISVDTAILAGARKVANARRLPQRTADERSASDLVPGAAPQPACRQYLARSRRGRSSRTFLGEEAAGVDAVRIAHARIAAGQSELTLVGGAYNGARWDVLLIFEQAGALLKGEFAPVWDRGPGGGIALGNIGAFLVLESRRSCAGARGPRAGTACGGLLRPQPASTGRHRSDAPPPMGHDRSPDRPRPCRRYLRRRRA